LFLAASPCETRKVGLDLECAVIERELRMTESRDELELCSKWAVTVDDMARHLLQLQPTILHFSGHGAPGTPHRAVSSPARRDVGGVGPARTGGIYLQNEHGGSHIVTPRALRMMIRSSAASVRLVVLNACYSDDQADELRSAVDCVVGMTGAIRDDAARAFAAGFYRALGHRCSVGEALEHARATLACLQLPDEQPQCRTRDGIDANSVKLAPT
jgi:CHAT domain-containing protein